ncbi:EamA family transporter [Comamonas serinivorans]|uniref:EamA family transporter n=1 Tax=Comamonas serinivorans TaxID=1082851 RepID=A0A1Y0EKE4_9BURK|nr:DMT family transporter [Comamonas serinivorans]ARU03839.1 EamA family transporter [Comamonas serinivorans]
MNYAFPLLAVLIWSANTVVSKLAAGAIAPTEIGFLRWVLAAALLTPFLLPRCLRQAAVIRPQLGRIVVLGLLGMVIYQTLAYFAASHTTATHMGIILTLSPMMVLGMAVLLGQTLTTGALLGSVLAIVGVALVVSGGNLAELAASGLNRGDAMMLLAALAYAAYNILLKRWPMAGISTWQLLYLQMLVAVVAQLPLYLAAPKVGLNVHNLPLVAFAGTMASIAAPLLWMIAVQRLGASRSSMFFNLTPLFTALIAAVVLHEQLNLAQWLGGALTLIGVLLAERWTRPLRRRIAPTAQSA